MTNDEKPSSSDSASDEYNSDQEYDYGDEKASLSSHEASPALSDSEDSELDSEFSQPAPSRLKRFGLAIFAVLLLWIAIQMRSAVMESKTKPKIVYASRYSKEHKFRPAASPIITETLKDGRIRLRGAMPPPTSTPKPKPVTKRKIATSKKKKTRKTKRKGSVANKRV